MQLQITPGAVFYQELIIMLYNDNHHQTYVGDDPDKAQNSLF